MWLVFLLLFFILGIVFSNIEANLYKIELTEKSFDFKVRIYLKLFGVFKIFYVNLNKNGIKIFNKIIKYKFLVEEAKVKKFEFNLLKELDLKIKKVDFTLKIGLLEIALTNIIIVLFSSIFPILLKSRIDRKSIKYKILPVYNSFYINFIGKIVVSINLKNIIKLYFKNIKQENTHNKIKNYG